jgi:hypothetical protein
MESSKMLLLISQAPIVSTDTLRADHLCAALISEAERLGVELDRDLWQPAAAIVAHGQYGGICLKLPPRLEEISNEIVQGLFDALNREAPSGCYLGSSDGDGACFQWQLEPEAQVEAINVDPASEWEAMTLEIPEHWLSAIVNGDESGFDYCDDTQDYRAYKAFCEGEPSDGWRVSSCDGEGQFSRSHDASAYGVLPCNVVTCIAMRRKPKPAQSAEQG